MIVVVRTSHWCGYCRNQLAALNHSVAKMRAAGFGVAAIAPDAPDLVGEFAQFAKLEYPLLADEGAAYVERLGLLNPNMSSSGRQNGGRVPYPGHILLDASGVVRASEFTDDLRHRLDGASLVFEHVNAEVGEVVGAASDDVLGAELSGRARRAGNGESQDRAGLEHLSRRGACALSRRAPRGCKPRLGVHCRRSARMWA